MDTPANAVEKQRLQELRSLNVLDTEAEQAFDDIVSLAAFICDTPMAVISLIDEDRQWCKAKFGLSAAEVPRDQAFCAHAIVKPDELMEVPNALEDLRFVDNPLVLGDLGLRFYAGAPLVTSSGAALGTVCVMDKVPRKLTEAQSLAMKALSRQVVQLLALRRANAELKTLSEDLAVQTFTDPLTGVKNRRAFDSLLANEYARSMRTRSPLALLMVDADHFKAYNDQYGHVAGDLALQAIAGAIQSQARAYDHVARYGGEEFAVILPDTHVVDVRAVAERIRQAVQGLEGLCRPMTVSVGAAMAGPDASVVDLVDRADQALYLAKQDGRNRVYTTL